MASAISALTGTNNSSSSAASATGSTNSLSSAPSEQMFLQLLVSQLQNQDPLNPADSTQFVAELAQFSELEQVIGIRGDIESQMASSSTATGTAATGTDANSSAANGTTSTNKTNTDGQTSATNSIS
jgi:flagellar basal-body rod modification protein FlgD